MLGSLFVLCSLIAATTTQESSSSSTCESIGAKLESIRMTVTAAEGDNVTFLCYKKQNTNAVWRLRIWNGEYHEIQEISSSTNTPGVLLESEVDVEVHSVCNSVRIRDCNQTGKLFQYHCFSLTFLEVNTTLHESLISCGYEENVTLCNGNNVTQKSFYVDPFQLKVNKSSGGGMNETTTPPEVTDTSGGGVTGALNSSCTCNSVRDSYIVSIVIVSILVIDNLILVIFAVAKYCKANNKVQDQVSKIATKNQTPCTGETNSDKSNSDKSTQTGE